MRSFVLLTALVMLFTPAGLRAQRDANVWYFGYGAGIDFNGPAPVALGDGAVRQPEGVASIADPVTGALLFYTDGVTVWNRLHRPMPGGRGLKGHESATQSALIVPAPCEANRYYVFTADASEALDPPNDGIHYSVVDMTADGGLGDVVVLNVPIDAPASEKLVAVRHANGIDAWVIFHRWQSNQFAAHLVSQSGVATQPVRSYIGSVHEGLPQYAAGYLKASPDGRRLASVMVGASVEVFSFDAATGLIDSNLTLSSSGLYGVSFSPDSRLLYVMEDTTLYQYNLAAGSRWGILNSKTAVGGGYLYAMQLAPDGRIYIATSGDYVRENVGWLGTIDNPNAVGPACGFNARGFRLAVGATELVAGQGLPNFIDSFDEGIVRPCGPPAAAIAVDEPICAGSCARFRDASRNIPTRWQWDFPGASPSSSNEQHPPAVCFPTPGQYQVTLTVTNAYGTDVVVRTLTVVDPGELRARMVELVASPGDTVAIPLFIDAPPAGPIDTVRITTRFDRSSMAPLGYDADAGLLRGWNIQYVVDDPTATVAITATAPPGRYLTGAGRLLDLRYATWIGDSTRIVLPADVSMSGLQCRRVVTSPGGLILDICGVEFRAVEPLQALALSTSGPNPFHHATALRIVVGVDGPVRLSVHDDSGRDVAVLLDAWTTAGAHEIPWAPTNLPSGMYTCRLRAAGGTVTARFVLVR